jgi:hypothetical protein
MFPLLPPAFFTYGPAIGEQGSAGLCFEFVDGHLERTVGPVGWKILDAYRAWVASTAHAGLNFLDRPGQPRVQRRLAVYFEDDRLARVEGDVVAAAAGAEPAQ